MERTHITDVELAQYEEHKLGTVDRARIEVHLADCDECIEHLAALSRLAYLPRAGDVPHLDAVTRRQATRLVQSDRAPFFSRIVPVVQQSRFALAGVAAMVVGIAVLVLQQADGPSRFRSPEIPVTNIALSPADGSFIRPDETVFHWTAVPNSVAYRFVLLSEDGRMLWTSVVSDTLMTIPASIALINNHPYYWRVEMLFPDDSRHRTPANAFVVRK